MDCSNRGTKPQLKHATVAGFAPGLRFLCPTPLQDPTVRLTETQATCSDPQENSCADKQGKIYSIRCPKLISKFSMSKSKIQEKQDPHSRCFHLSARPPRGCVNPAPSESRGPAAVLRTGREVGQDGRHGRRPVQRAPHRGAPWGQRGIGGGLGPVGPEVGGWRWVGLVVGVGVGRGNDCCRPGVCGCGNGSGLWQLC